MEICCFDNTTTFYWILCQKQELCAYQGNSIAINRTKSEGEGVSIEETFFPFFIE